VGKQGRTAGRNSGEKGRDELARPWIRTFYLADKAEVVNNKLYVMGGYVDITWAPKFPTAINLTALLTLGIPAILAGHTVKFGIHISSPLVGSIAQIDGTTVANRGPGQLDESIPLRAILTLPVLVPVPSPGTIALQATVDGGATERVELRVIKIAQ